MRRFDAERLRVLVVRLAEAAGVPRQDAAVLAESLLYADLRGISTHGISRLGIYLRRIARGLIDPRAELKLEHQHGAVLVVDAANGLGQVQAMKVLRLLTPLARTSGVAAATIRRSQHLGALSFFCDAATAADQILLVCSNGEPAMAPEGGRQPYFGTNPIAASFPRGKGLPLRVDLATSIVARGHIIAASRRGERIPPTWALDDEGEPTTDPDEALKGSVRTMAAAKGYALAMLVESLAGVLSGAAVGLSVGSMYKDLDRPQDVGHFFCLLDIAAFLPSTAFKARLDTMIDEIKHTARRSETNEILVPGERSARRAEENERVGVALGDETVRELEGLCRDYGVDGGL